MSKITKSAASHRDFPGYLDAYQADTDGWTVSVERYLTDMDLAPFFQGAEQDQCQASHLGYMLKGRFGVRTADGAVEIFEAGDAFVIGPGHTPVVFAGGEFVAFTRTDEARQEDAVVLPNVLRYAREHGIEIPEQTPTSPT
jgi:hypothetical protein